MNCQNNNDKSFLFGFLRCTQPFLATLTECQKDQLLKTSGIRRYNKKVLDGMRICAVLLISHKWCPFILVPAGLNVEIAPFFCSCCDSSRQRAPKITFNDDFQFCLYFDNAPLWLQCTSLSLPIKHWVRAAKCRLKMAHLWHGSSITAVLI